MKHQQLLAKQLRLLTPCRRATKPCYNAGQAYRSFTATSHQSRRAYSSSKPSLPPAPKLSSKAVTIYAIAAVFVALGIGKQLKDSGGKKVFDPPRFTPFEIVAREEASPTSIILTLRTRNLPATKNGETSDPFKEEWERGIWSVEVKQPELQIARRYTPLPPTPGTSKSDLGFLIRKEHKGEVSGYLYTLKVGSEIGLRGPHTEYTLADEVQNVVFLAAGTGIAPALQVAHTLLERSSAEKQKSRIHVFWSNRRREDCLGGTNSIVPDLKKDGKGIIVRALEDLKQQYPGQISVEYLVDEEGTFLDETKISRLVTSRAVEQMPNDSKLILISGPEGFVNSFAGPKKWDGGKEGQGIIGGVLGRMRLKDWIVWKL